MNTTNTALVANQPSRPSALRTMAGRLNVDPEHLLKSLKETVCKGCTDSELMAFSIVANEYGLNPFIKHIYAFPAKGGGIVPVVSVDGWITMANNHPQMDGLEFTDEHDEKNNLFAIACTIHRKDRTRPVVVREYLSECRRNTEPWKMEHRMLRHKALIQCARYAFGFSGVYDEDEAADIARSGGMRDVTPKETRTGSFDSLPGAEPVTETPAPAPTPAAPARRGRQPKPEATPPANEEPPAPERPTREQMGLDLQAACDAAGITPKDAAPIYRSAVSDSVDPAKKMSEYTNDELFLVWQIRNTALQPPTTPTDEQA